MPETEKFSPDHPLVIGLLGGVAAGKSAIAALLADFGLRVLDADQIAKDVLESPELLPEVVALLGEEIVGDAGYLDRAKIADLVFTDPSLRRELEALTHPAIRQRLMQELSVALRGGRSAVLDVPLLLEGGLIERCDYSIYIQASDELRRQRAGRRGMSADDWRRREQSQASLEVKRQQADYLLLNESDLASVKRKVWGLLRQIQEATVG